MSEARKKAEKIIYMLNDRKGFDGWYHDIWPEDKEEILTEISKIIEEPDKP